MVGDFFFLIRENNFYIGKNSPLFVKFFREKQKHARNTTGYFFSKFYLFFHWNKISIFFQISFTRQLRAISFSSEHFIRPIISRDSRSMVRNGNDRWRAITLSRPSFEVSRVRSVVLSPFTRTTHVGRHLSKYHERRPDPIPPRPAKFTRVLGPRRLFAVCETIVGKIRAGTIKKGEREGGKKEGTSNHV